MFPQKSHNFEPEIRKEKYTIYKIIYRFTEIYSGCGVEVPKSYHIVEAGVVDETLLRLRTSFFFKISGTIFYVNSLAEILIVKINLFYFENQCNNYDFEI